MSVTFNFTAPEDQVGGDNVDQINIYASSDGTSFTLEATGTIAASDTSYIYAAGDASTYYRISFTDTDGYESPQSDTLYGDDTYTSATVATIINQIRYDIGDYDESDYTYTDATMLLFIEKAVNIILKGRLGITDFNYTYANGAISPDPSANTDDHITVRRLIVLAVETIIERNEYRSAIGRSIKIRDADTELNTGGSLGSYKDLVSGAGGAKDEFEKAIREFTLDKGAAAYY